MQLWALPEFQPVRTSYIRGQTTLQKGKVERKTVIIKAVLDSSEGKFPVVDSLCMDDVNDVMKYGLS